MYKQKETLVWHLILRRGMFWIPWVHINAKSMLKDSLGSGGMQQRVLLSHHLLIEILFLLRCEERKYLLSRWMGTYIFRYIVLCITQVQRYQFFNTAIWKFLNWGQPVYFTAKEAWSIYFMVTVKSSLSTLGLLVLLNFMNCWARAPRSESSRYAPGLCFV